MHKKYQVIRCEAYIFQGDTFSVEQAENFLKEYDTDCDTILASVWEVPYYKMSTNWRQGYKNLVQTAKRKLKGRIFVILDSWYRPYYQDLLDPAVDDVLLIDYFLVRTYNEVVVKKLCDFKKIPDVKNPFLFLTGKPSKLNRARLLYKLQQKNLLENSIWSFYPIKDKINQEHSTMPEITVDEYIDFTNKYQRQPDNVQFKPSGHSYFFIPIPYDVKLYNSTGFSIVSETVFNNTHSTDAVFITEKTWIPILNNHAFIIAGVPGILKQLSIMGFRTFEEYLPVKYDNILDHEQRLNAIVENVEFLVNNIDTLKNNLINDISYNYQHFINLVLTNIDSVINFAKLYNWQMSDIEDLINTADKPL